MLTSFRLCWTGPATPEAIQKDFDSILGREVVLNGNVFIRADKDKVEKLYRLKLEKKSVFRPEHEEVSAGGLTTLFHMISPGAYARMQAYDKIRPLHEGPDGAFLADLDHWPDAPGGACGPMFPCQLTHGTVLSWKHQRLFLGSEATANGWNLFPSSETSASAPVTPAIDILMGLSDPQQKKLPSVIVRLETVCACQHRACGVRQTGLGDQASRLGSATRGLNNSCEFDTDALDDPSDTDSDTNEFWRQAANDVEHMPMHIMLRQSFSVRHSAIASAWLQFLRGVRGITFKAANLAFSLLSFAM
jgi:hypothetical protein